MRLLVTRPQPRGAATAAALRARGHDVWLAPLLRIEALPNAPLGAGPWDAVVMTSANAASALMQHPGRARLVGLPAYAVGRRTAEAARAAGFLRVESADGDGGDLMRLVAERGPRRVLYLAGEERAGDLAAELRSRGIAVDMLVIYRAVADGRLRDDIRAALTAGEIAVLHFSQRSASAFLTAARADGLLDAALDATHFCLSRQVAQPLADAGARHIRVAARPDEAALLDLVEQR